MYGTCETLCRELAVKYPGDMPLMLVIWSPEEIQAARVTASVTCFPGSVSGACVAVPRSPWPRSFAPLTPLLSGCSPASPLL